MTTPITAPQVCYKHPDEELWIEFSFTKIFNNPDLKILQTGTVTLTADLTGLIFTPAEAIIENQSLFIYVKTGVDAKDYKMKCSVDSTLNGATKYSRRTQIGRIFVRSS